MTKRQERRLPNSTSRIHKDMPYREKLFVSFNGGNLKKYIIVTVTEGCNRNQGVQKWVDENHPGKITSFTVIHVSELLS